MQQENKHRPFGVTILAILAIIGGIAFLANGVTAVSLTVIPQTLLGGLSVGTGVALLALGIAYFVMAYGLLKGKGWAWTITVLLSYIGIALGLVSIVTGHVGAIFNVIINALILYYIYRPHVKSFFGKTTMAPTSAMRGKT
jgi:uncharacterized membrane protein HdeD (DUF308 family)